MEKVKKLPPRKRLWLSIRESYPQLTIKAGKEFEEKVRKKLLDLLKLEYPLTYDQDTFINNEVSNLSVILPDYWHKCKRVQNVLFSKHKRFFDKVYPVETDVREVKTPAKRPHEEKSRTQKWRDKVKLIQEGREAIFGAAALVCQREGDKDGAFVVKRLKDDPSIAQDLRKTIIDLDHHKDEGLIYYQH